MDQCAQPDPGFQLGAQRIVGLGDGEQRARIVGNRSFCRSMSMISACLVIAQNGRYPCSSTQDTGACARRWVRASCSRSRRCSPSGWPKPWRLVHDRCAHRVSSLWWQIIDGCQVSSLGIATIVIQVSAERCPRRLGSRAETDRGRRVACRRAAAWWSAGRSSGYPRGACQTRQAAGPGSPADARACGGADRGGCGSRCRRPGLPGVRRSPVRRRTGGAAALAAAAPATPWPGVRDATKPGRAASRTPASIPTTAAPPVRTA